VKHCKSHRPVGFVNCYHQAIVVCAFVLDLLSAVFLGVALSTFIFVAAFFRSGVVKYVANGKIIHSTIERSFRMSEWLDDEGDLIEVLCLQNYLFFGNATAVYTYICASFESNSDNKDVKVSPKNRKPQYLILDLTLVTGMDTSTVDIFLDIKNLCNANKCKLMMAGMSPNIRSILSLGGFKADAGVRSKRQVRFFPSLDAALGKAEDMLLEAQFEDKEYHVSANDGRKRLLDSKPENGFRTALSHIDAEVSYAIVLKLEKGNTRNFENAKLTTKLNASFMPQHGENFSMELVALQEYTTMIELKVRKCEVNKFKTPLLCFCSAGSLRGVLILCFFFIVFFVIAR
jgi:hypothetical protein